MRKYWLGGLALLLIVAAYHAWPLIGAAQLATAARSQDAQAVLEHIDEPALRQQLTRQIVRAYLDESGRGPKDTVGRNFAVSLGTSVAEPYVAELLTPENLTSLLRNGRIAQAPGKEATAISGVNLPNFSAFLDSGLWTVFSNAGFDGWTSYLIAVPAKQDAETFGVHLHLSGLSWKLSGIDLPKSLLARVVHEVAQRQKSS
jgi:Protein of unknown function (DUF2939)